MQKHNKKKLSAEEISEVIEMALSDHVSFENIQFQYGIDPNQVKLIMKKKHKTWLLQSLARARKGFFFQTQILQVTRQNTLGFKSL